MSSNKLTIRGDDELVQLETIPKSVTEIEIAEIEESFEMPLLPAHVKKLTLVYAKLSTSPKFAEGLESLTIDGQAQDVSDLSDWGFPSTLKYFAYTEIDELTDLRGVPDGCRISVTSNVAPEDVILPVGLKELENWEEEIDLSELPPNLVELQAINAYEFTGTDQSYPSMESLILIETIPDLAEVFPNLKKLKFFSYGAETLNLSHPELRELILWNGSVTEPVRLDTPKLESLFVAGDGDSAEFDLSQNTGLGETLVSLSLKTMNVFPVDTNWERLESVTLVQSPVELPYIQWLKTLDTDTPVTTNGVTVESIEQYKAAWGFKSKKKGVSRTVTKKASPDSKKVKRDANAVRPDVRNLTVRDTKLPLNLMFPNLEKLTVRNVFQGRLVLELPKLRTLEVIDCSIRDPIVLDTPKLKHLTIIKSSPEDNMDFSANPSLGSTLVTLVMESVQDFPVETTWERLESVTAIQSELELPYIEHLAELSADMNLTTNGYSVDSLEEYKAAWESERPEE